MVTRISTFNAPSLAFIIKRTGYWLRFDKGTLFSKICILLNYEKFFYRFVLSMICSVWFTNAPGVVYGGSNCPVIWSPFRYSRNWAIDVPVCAISPWISAMPCSSTISTNWPPFPHHWTTCVSVLAMWSSWKAWCAKFTLACHLWRYYIWSVSLAQSLYPQVFFNKWKEAVELHLGDVQYTISDKLLPVISVGF